ncbi:MAG: hypothetical protein QG553_151 [Patescibacteria group bacterium]|nr:hypothetical protein [Patescibacteria group bacterium]
MAKQQRRRPQVSGLHAESGNIVGRGQDNLVHGLKLPPEARLLAESGDWVVKISHKTPNQRRQERWSIHQADEAVVRGTHYKKNKYEILTHFLGDYIPESMFLASTVEENGVSRPAEIIVQKRVPNVRFMDLNPDQQRDPRLLHNVRGLFNGLKYMYSVIGEVNSRTSDGVNLDGKLDLGGISDFVKGESVDYKFTDQDAEKTTTTSKTKNILVDPETMDIYCIDFDQGDWMPGMDEAKEMIFEIDAQRQDRADHAAQVALRGYMSPPER